MDDHVPPQDSLHTRVAVLEVTVALLRTEFESMRRTIVGTGVSVVLAFLGLLVGANAYFLKQKDDIIERLDTLVRYERLKER